MRPLLAIGATLMGVIGLRQCDSEPTPPNGWVKCLAANRDGRIVHTIAWPCHDGTALTIDQRVRGRDWMTAHLGVQWPSLVFRVADLGADANDLLDYQPWLAIVDDPGRDTMRVARLEEFANSHFAILYPRIAGHVTFGNGLPFMGVRIDTTDPNIASQFTDANGWYCFHVPYEWSGDVTPSYTPEQAKMPGIKHVQYGARRKI